ncbi:MAG: hypothetical protein KBD63_07735 [Bacteriovoracaceae bacterium]|nr:hypothetical protein [Bacteriovoracaceae bacterium]
MSDFKPFAAFKGVMGSFDKKIGPVNTEPMYGFDKAEKIAVPVNGNVITVTPGTVVALLFKKDDVKKPISIGKIVNVLKSNNQKVEFKNSKIISIDFQGDLNTEQNKTDSRRMHRKFNPPMESLDKDAYESVDQMLQVITQLPYFSPPHHVEEHNQVAGEVVLAYCFHHFQDAEPAFIVELDFTHLEKSKSTEELLEEEHARQRAERDSERPQRASSEERGAMASKRFEEGVAAKAAEKALADAKRQEERAQREAERKAALEARDKQKAEERAEAARKREEARKK